MTSCGPESAFNSGSFQPVKEKAEQHQIPEPEASPENGEEEVAGAEGHTGKGDLDAEVAGNDEGSDRPEPDEAVPDSVEGHLDSPLVAEGGEEQGEDSNDQLALDDGEASGDEDNSESPPPEEIKTESFVIENSKAFHLGNNNLGNSNLFNTDCQNRDDLLNIPTAGSELTLEVTVPQDTVWNSMAIKSLCGLDASGSLKIANEAGDNLAKFSLKRLQSSLESGALDFGPGIYHITVKAGTVLFVDLDDILIDDLQISYTGSGDSPVMIKQLP